MVCLVDYIGLKTTGAIPASGLYINSLAGMSTELADKIANSEQITFMEVWKDVQTRAFLRLQNDVVNIINDTATFEQVLFQTKKPRIYQNQAVLPILATHKGVYVCIPESKFVSFYLKEIYVFSNEIVATTVKVFDLNDGTVLHTQSVSLVVGLNTIAIDKTFDTRYGTFDLFIGVDSTAFSTVEFLPEYFNFYDCHNQCATSFGHDYLVIEPATLPLAGVADIDNLVKFSSGQGVAIGAEIQCSIEQFICINKKSLQQSLLYLLGAEMLLQKLGSPRLNFFSSSNLEGTNSLRAEFEGRYLSNLKRTLKTLPMDDVCFDCSSQSVVSYKYNTP